MNGVSFRRQHAIGDYIVDFVSIKRKLVIELDGSQHLEQAEYDVEQSGYFESQGYKVIRFWNNQVESDIESTIHVIEVALVEKVNFRSSISDILSIWFQIMSVAILTV